MWFFPVAYAQEAVPVATDTAAGGQPFTSSIMFIVMIFGAMFFFMILPNQRREKERKAMLGSLAKGNKVITTGGILGTVVGVNEKTVVLKVSDSPVTKLEFVRGSIAQVTSKETGDEK